MESAFDWCTYRLDAPIEVVGHLWGQGRQTVLDFSRADPRDFPERACVILRGSARLSDVRVISPGGLVVPVKLIDCQGARVESVQAQDSAHAQIYVSGGTDNLIDHCHAEGHDPGNGLGYGVVLADCSHVTVRDCHMIGARHGIAQGPATDCTIVGCRIESDAHYAADAHPGTERIEFLDCRISNGLNLAGSSHTVRGCRIGVSSAGECIHLHELADLDHEIVDCRLTGPTANGQGAIDWDRPADNAPAGGLLRIIGNRIAAGGRPIYMRNHWGVGGVQIDANRLDGSEPAYLQAASASVKWRTAIVRGNTLSGGTAIAVTNVESLIESGNVAA